VTPLRGDGERQTFRERGRLRRHLEELTEAREDGLRDLGGLALEMYRREAFDGRLLWRKAAEVAAIEDEAALVRRGLEEGLTVAQLEELARDGE
jgi:hypothetical protein